MHVLLSVSLSLVCLLSLILIVFLLRMVAKAQQNSTNLMQTQLANQLVENQKLRNMLLASDVPTLAGLNHTTLPSSESQHLGSDPIMAEDSFDLGEAINFEEM